MKIRGQMQISFGVIFSIIIIIATLSVAGYVMVKVWNVQNNVNCALFYTSLQNKIDSAWGSDGSSSYIFKENLPTSVDKICFGSVNQTVLNKSDEPIKKDLSDYSTSKINFFLYPKDGCGDSEFKYTLKHVSTTGFFCINVVKGQGSVKITKNRFDTLVKLSY